MKNNARPSLVEERFFPFECGDSHGVESGFRILHHHQELEICYIKQGEGIYIINGVEYSFKKGDIFIINNDDIHRCLNDRNLIMQVIMFDPSLLKSGSASPLDSEYLRPFTEASGSFRSRLDGDDKNTAELAALLSEIEHEYTHRKNGYELMIKSLLLRFLTLIIRNSAENDRKAVHEGVSRRAAERVKEAAAYIDAHYAEEITLADLAGNLDISVPYLCSSFKRVTGISPIDFLIRKRIAEAMEELISTKKSVITISGECGFRSLSNFNHLFKALAGCSPTEYRNSRKSR